MTYQIKTSTQAQRYNARMDKIWEHYKEQQRQKDVIAKRIYKLEYDKLSDKKKHKIDYIWGDENGI